MSGLRLEEELRSIVATGGTGTTLDALTLLADAHGLRSAALWELAVARLIWRGGFGGGDERPLPQDLWGPELQRTISEATVSVLQPAPRAWAQGDRPHLLVPILDETGVAGVVIATTGTVDEPAALAEQCQALAPLLRPSGEAQWRLVDALESDVGDMLLTALEEVRRETGPGAERAAKALRSAYAELRAATAGFRDAPPTDESLGEAVVRHGGRYGLSVEQDLKVSGERLQLEDRVALVEIIREALESAAVWGRARTVRLSARQTRSGIRLVVDDDGVSPDHVGQPRRQGGHCHAAIEGHATRRGGSVTVAPSERGGLKLEVTLPSGRHGS